MWSPGLGPSAQFTGHCLVPSQPSGKSSQQAAWVPPEGRTESGQGAHLSCLL